MYVEGSLPLTYPLLSVMPVIRKAIIIKIVPRPAKKFVLSSLICKQQRGGIWLVKYQMKNVSTGLRQMMTLAIISTGRNSKNRYGQQKKDIINTNYHVVIKFLVEASSLDIAFPVHYTSPKESNNVLSINSSVYIKVIMAPKNYESYRLYACIDIGSSVTLAKSEALPAEYWKNIYPPMTSRGIGGQRFHITKYALDFYIKLGNSYYKIDIYQFGRSSIDFSIGVPFLDRYGPLEFDKDYVYLNNERIPRSGFMQPNHKNNNQVVWIENQQSYYKSNQEEDWLEDLQSFYIKETKKLAKTQDILKDYFECYMMNSEEFDTTWYDLPLPLRMRFLLPSRIELWFKHLTSLFRDAHYEARYGLILMSGRQMNHFWNFLNYDPPPQESLEDSDNESQGSKFSTESSESRVDPWVERWHQALIIDRHHNGWICPLSSSSSNNSDDPNVDQWMNHSEGANEDEDDPT
eukprot:Gb_17447 [translate_table: standard]